MSDDPFAALAEAQTPSPIKSQRKAVETRRSRAAQSEKKMEDEAKLLISYRRYKREQRETLLSGPFGPQVTALMTIMRGMRLDRAPELIRYVQRSAWIRSLSLDDRHILLGMIGRSITKLREKNGLQPFDDGLWKDPPKAYERVRALMEIK
jgi:hypothetical protein